MFRNSKGLGAAAQAAASSMKSGGSEVQFSYGGAPYVLLTRKPRKQQPGLPRGTIKSPDGQEFYLFLLSNGEEVN